MHRISRYLSKYLTKELLLSAPLRSRRVTTSRGIKLLEKRPSEIKWEFLRVLKADDQNELVFHTRSGKPYSDTNLLHRELKPAGAQIGAPWLNWHTLRRTHCTLFQQAGGSLRDAQAQLGHSKMSTTLEIYTIPIDAQRREVVEKLDVLVTSGDEFRLKDGEMQNLRMPTTQIQ